MFLGRGLFTIAQVNGSSDGAKKLILKVDGDL
jgi:hypothetical protein